MPAEVDSDRPVVIAQELPLGLEEPAAHPDAVDEDDGLTCPLVLVVQLHTVDRCARHLASLAR